MPNDSRSGPTPKDRPYFNHSVEEMQTVFKENLRTRPVLADLRDELKRRRTEKARRLLAEVKGVLEGVVPTKPKKPRPGKPEDQEELF